MEAEKVKTKFERVMGKRWRKRWRVFIRAAGVMEVTGVLSVAVREAGGGEGSRIWRGVRGDWGGGVGVGLGGSCWGELDGEVDSWDESEE